jgi:phage shock protein C
MGCKLIASAKGWFVMRKLYKSRNDVKFDGVCGGVAEYLGIDATLIRLAWAIAAFCWVGIPAYIVCMVIMPRDPGYIDHPEHSANGQYR